MRKRLTIVIIAALFIILPTMQMIRDCKYEAMLCQDSGKAAYKKNYVIFVEIEDKTLYLLRNGKCVKKYPVATGKPGLPSPIGYWKIVSKGDWGEGFGGRWMGLNVTWGKYGIHGTDKEGSIGYAASHGCIRMYRKDVRELYNLVPHGTPVVIVEGCFGPFGRGFKNLEPGDRGADVTAIQQRLKQLGYFKGWASGIYDDSLKHAVHRFQAEHNLTVSNTINKKCWQAMGFREFE